MLIPHAPQLLQFPFSSLLFSSVVVLTYLAVQSDTVFAQNTNEAMFRDVQLRSLAGSQIKYIDILKMSSSRPDGHIQNWIKEGVLATYMNC